MECCTCYLTTRTCHIKYRLPSTRVNCDHFTCMNVSVGHWQYLPRVVSRQLRCGSFGWLRDKNDDRQELDVKSHWRICEADNRWSSTKIVWACLALGLLKQPKMMVQQQQETDYQEASGPSQEKMDSELHRSWRAIRVHYTRHRWCKAVYGQTGYNTYLELGKMSGMKWTLEITHFLI